MKDEPLFSQIINDIIIERDNERVIAWIPDNSNPSKYKILWDNYYEGMKYFSFENEKILQIVHEDNSLSYIDIDTGIILSKFYRLWKGWHAVYGDGLLYMSGSNTLYSIKPNTEWE